MSTSVKDVSAVMKTFTANVGNTKFNGTKTSFQDVWNSQTGKNAASDASTQETPKASEGVDKMQRGEKLKQKDAAKVDVKEPECTEDVQPKELDEQQLEEAMAVLGAAATELVQEIADTFGMSVEEVEQVMADMDMEAVDVLDPGILSALLLEVGGAQDSLALLTDENLCYNFQMLMNRQKEVLAEVSEELQITPEQLTKLVEEMTDFQVSAEDVPMVETADVAEEPVIILETEEPQTDDTHGVETQANVLTENAVTKTEDQQKAQNDSKEQHTDTAKDHGENVLLQNLKNDSFQTEVQQVAAKASAWSENTQDIMNQIMDYMKIHVKSEESSLEMQLHPASLGTLQVNVSSKGGVLTANFVTQNETVKTVLESQMIQLKESFAEQGVKVEAIEVTVQTHQFESNLEQGRGRQQNETDKKDKPRRINLNASFDMDNIEEMTQEEQLAAEIMTANGSTVDYTA